MTRIKSLGFGKNKDNLGYGNDIVNHRTHRSLKGRYAPTEKFAKKMQYKRKLEKIRIEELEDL